MAKSTSGGGAFKLLLVVVARRLVGLLGGDRWRCELFTGDLRVFFPVLLTIFGEGDETAEAGALLGRAVDVTEGANAS